MISPFNNVGKKLIVLLPALLIALLVSFPIAKADDADWTGYTPISSKEELDSVRNNLSGKFYLTTDIVFTAQDFASGGAFFNDGAGWLPIGARNTGAFTGTFDGNGHKIAGLKCSITTSIKEAGLFGYNKGTVQNLGMTDSAIRVNFTSAYNTYAGGIVGDNDGTIKNCYNTGNVSTNDYVAGGITGCNRSIISNCYNIGDIKSFAEGAGGIAGVNDTGTISDSYNTGNVYGFDAGGIVGYGADANGEHSNVSNCYNIGSVLGYHTGGIKGIDYYSGTVDNSYYLAGSGANAYGTALTLDEMKNQTSFTGFDFDNVWIIDGDDDAYPFPTLRNVAYLNRAENTDDFSGGAGTLLNPYRVSNTEQLNRVRNYSTSYFVLTQDIAFTEDDFTPGGVYYNDGAGWKPIGPDDKNAFYGFFDGKGYAISGLYCNVNTSNSIAYVGLFGCNRGIIQNLGLSVSTVRVAATSSNWCYTGGIAGANYGTIRDSFNTGDIATTVDNDATGGIAGFNYGAITGCHNEGNVKGKRDIGGIAGFSGNYGSISDCYNTGKIDGGIAGGIVGQMDSTTATIINCFNHGIVSSINWGYAGGIVGYISYGKITNCYNTGNISSYHAGGAGGIVAMNADTIENCYNTGNVSSDNVAGGIAGDNAKNMSNCYNTGNIISTANPPCAGGIAGYERKNAPINSCYFLDTISAGIGVLETGATNPTIKLTADQMKQQASYSGFDFANTWQKEEGKWPYLRVFSYHDLTGLEFEPGTICVVTGGTYQTKLRLTPETVSFANIVYTANADDGAITINDGVVTGIVAGTAYAVATDTITQKKTTCEVTVVQGVTGITISGSAHTVFVGDTLQLSAAVTPDDADNKKVFWSSSNDGIATVDQNGLVHAKSLGAVTLYAASTDGTNIQGSYSLTVYQPVQSVSLNVSEIQLKNGEAQTLSATVLPANATNKSVTWSSSDTAVATVDTAGKVTGKSRGTAVVKCKTADGGFEASCAVTVIQQVTGVSFAKQTINLGRGGKFQLVPIIAPANANNQNVTWDSNHEEFVTVSDDGLITGVGTGDSYGISVITVTTEDGKKTADCVVTVGKAVTSISLSKTQVTLTEGMSEALSVSEILPADAINKDIQWKTSDASVATVNANGNVTAVKPGTATITAQASDGTLTNTVCNVTVTTRTIFDITATPNNLAYGTVSGAGSYQVGAAVTLKAIPKAGYRFVQWLEGANAVSAEAECKFTVSVDRSLTAEFAAIAAPDVTAASNGYNSVLLTWAAVAGAKDYEVSRATSSTGKYTVLGTTTALSYNSTGLTTNATYYYKVRARCVTTTATTFGPYSSSKSAKPVLATVGSLSAVPVSYSSIKVSWRAVGGATKYEVYRATSSRGSYKPLTTTSYTYYTNTRVSTGTTYYYKVRAYHLEGNTKVYGAFSSVATAKTVLGIPGSVKAAPVSYSSIKVTWGAVTGASGYAVYRSTSSAGSYKLLTTTSYTYYTNTSVNTGTTYYYKVQAYRLVGRTKIYSGFSAVVSTKTVLATPSSVKVARLSSTSMKITWGAVSGATKYEIWQSESDGVTGEYTYTLLASTSTAYYTYSSITPGKYYQYKVRAYRLIGTIKVYSNFSTVVVCPVFIRASAVLPYKYVTPNPNPDGTSLIVKCSFGDAGEMNSVLINSVKSMDGQIWIGVLRDLNALNSTSYPRFPGLSIQVIQKSNGKVLFYYYVD